MQVKKRRKRGMQSFIPKTLFCVKKARETVLKKNGFPCAVYFGIKGTEHSGFPFKE